MSNLSGSLSRRIRITLAAFVSWIAWITVSDKVRVTTLTSPVDPCWSNVMESLPELNGLRLKKGFLKIRAVFSTIEDNVQLEDDKIP